MLPRQEQSSNGSQPLDQRGTNWRLQGGQGGFSLIELLLVLTLVLLLAGAVCFNFSSLMRVNRLAEGTTQLETLLRFARAQAATSGRKVQLVFSAESTNAPAAPTGEVRATWEPDPLGQPGCFSDLGEAQWHLQEINDLVQVESVKLLDSHASDPQAAACPEDEEGEETNAPVAKPVTPITFYPDGSSDSAEIIVASRAVEEDQRMAVRLVGLTGSISHQLLSADLEESSEVPGLLERSSAVRRENLARTAPERDSTSRLLGARPMADSARSVSTGPRTTVGETNEVDTGE